VVVTIAILFVAQFAVVPLSALIEASPRLTELISRPTWPSLGVFVLLQGSVCAAVVLAVWAWTRFVERRRLRDIGLRVTRTSILWLLLATIVTAGILLGVTALLPATGGARTGQLLFSDAPFIMSLIAVIVQGFVLQAFPEELLFRGMLLSSMRARPVLAVTVTTLAFTVIHLVSNGGQQTLGDHVLYLAVPFGFALLAVGMLLWTRSLWAAVGVHGGLHLGNAFAVFLPQTTNAALSWVVIGGAHGLLGLALIVFALRRGRRIPAGAEEWR